MSKAEECPVCQETNASIEDEGDHGNNIRWNCSRCGRFHILGSANGPLHRMNSQQRANLSGWIFEQNSERSIPKLTREIVGQVTARRLPTVSDRADRLLLEVLRGQTRLGASFNIGEPRFIAATYSQDHDEVIFLIDMLSDRGLIESPGYGGDAKVLPEGYVAADALARRTNPSDKVFVAMSFDESLENIYTDGFLAGIMSAGYDPVRVDQVEHVNRIDDEIIAQIRTASFVVADFTGHKGGVYFEAGFALGLNLPVIWTCHKDDMAKLHFDIRQYNTIDWDTPENLALRLKRRIEATVGKGPKAILAS